jgi:hypothetical protein
VRQMGPQYPRAPIRARHARHRKSVRLPWCRGSPCSPPLTRI